MPTDGGLYVASGQVRRSGSGARTRRWALVSFSVMPASHPRGDSPSDQRLAPSP